MDAYGQGKNAFVVRSSETKGERESSTILERESILVFFFLSLSPRKAPQRDERAIADPLARA